MRSVPTPCPSWLVAAAVSPALAQPVATAPDAAKSSYHLFNPTPRELWRELSPDRPDLTESPYTVDAGAVQIELSFAEFTHNDAGGVETNTLDLAPTNLKLGLTNTSDIQLIWTPYTHVESDDGDAGGPGDLQVRYKLNLWGNDAGDTAFGLLPYITIPVGDDDVAAQGLEGGLITPFAIDLAAIGLDAFSLGTQAEIAFTRSDDDASVDTALGHTAVLGYAATDGLALYLEYAGTLALDDADGYQPILSAGSTFAVSPDVLLDAGVRVGLDDDSTDDVTVFAGLTVRY